MRLFNFFIYIVKYMIAKDQRSVLYTILSMILLFLGVAWASKCIIVFVFILLKSKCISMCSIIYVIISIILFYLAYAHLFYSCYKDIKKYNIVTKLKNYLNFNNI